jgi:hypothetical protein
MPRLLLAMPLLTFALARCVFAADEPAAAPNAPLVRSAPHPTIGALDGKASERKRAQNPRVLFIVAKDCPRCEQELARLRRPGGDFAKMRVRGWKIGEGAESHLQIVDQETIPDLVAELKPGQFPTVACLDNGEVVRSFQSGCTTPLDLWTFGWLAKGVDERPAGSVPEAARVESTNHYPLRGNHWSIDEDWNPSRERVVAHLRGPAHGSHIAANWQIETWSLEELRSLHDNLHEQEVAAGGGYYAARSQPANPFAASRKVLGH